MHNVYVNFRGEQKYSIYIKHQFRNYRQSLFKLETFLKLQDDARITQFLINEHKHSNKPCSKEDNKIALNELVYSNTAGQMKRIQNNESGIALIFIEATLTHWLAGIETSLNTDRTLKQDNIKKKPARKQ